MIIALGETGAATDQMAHSLLEAHWRDDVDLSNTQDLKQIAENLGHNAQDLLALAGSEAVQKQLLDNSELARKASVFGSPTYIVNGDPFYGQDRLELVERALAQPFAPNSFKNPPVGGVT